MNTYDRPKKSVGTNWVKDGGRSAKERLVELQAWGVMPETPGVSTLHLRFKRETSQTDTEGEPLFERISFVLSLEDAVKLHSQIESLYLAPLKCPEKRVGKYCRGPKTADSGIPPCLHCETARSEHEAKWCQFRTWETQRRVQKASG